MADAAIEKRKRIALFAMLILGTVLHGISVADAYLPGLARVWSLLAQAVR